MEGDFSTGLFSCCSDCGVCIYGYFCPLCLNLQTWAHLYNESCGCRYLLFGISPFWVRQTIRRRKHMSDSCCCDTLKLCLCFECYICQNAREVNMGGAPAPATEYYKGNQTDQQKLQQQAETKVVVKNSCVKPNYGQAPPEYDLSEK